MPLADALDDGEVDALGTSGEGVSVRIDEKDFDCDSPLGVIVFDIVKVLVDVALRLGRDGVAVTSAVSVEDELREPVAMSLLFEVLELSVKVGLGVRLTVGEGESEMVFVDVNEARDKEMLSS